jgi:hypothetical protein
MSVTGVRLHLVQLCLVFAMLMSHRVTVECLTPFIPQGTSPQWNCIDRATGGELATLQYLKGNFSTAVAWSPDSAYGALQGQPPGAPKEMVFSVSPCTLTKLGGPCSETDGGEGYIAQWETSSCLNVFNVMQSQQWDDNVRAFIVVYGSKSKTAVEQMTLKVVCSPGVDVLAGSWDSSTRTFVIRSETACPGYSPSPPPTERPSVSTGSPETRNPSTPAPTEDGEGAGQSFSVPLIAGIIGGAVFFLLLTIVVACCCCRRSVDALNDPLIQ